jgi:hypothetical protein
VLQVAGYYYLLWFYKRQCLAELRKLLAKIREEDARIAALRADFYSLLERVPIAMAA